MTVDVVKSVNHKVGNNKYNIKFQTLVRVVLISKFISINLIILVK